jgi:outer membrane lipoprotein-sorting protein
MLSVNGELKAKIVPSAKGVLMDTRELLRVLFLLAVFTFPAHAGAGQPPVSEILKKVEAVYQNLQSYQFVAQDQNKTSETSRIDRPDGLYKELPNADVRNPAAVYVVARGVSEHIELAAFNPGKVRLWVKSSSISGQILVVSDGHTTWASMPLRKQYTEKATPLNRTSDAEAQAVPEELQFIKRYWSILVGQFCDISRFSPSARLGEDAHLKVGGKKIDCYDIKWQTGTANHEIWVDKDHFIVWRLKQTPRAGVPHGPLRPSDVTIDVSKADLNPKLDDSLFAFTPPEKFAKVESLTWPGEKTN